jgi:hypothetical protein
MYSSRDLKIPSPRPEEVVTMLDAERRLDEGGSFGSEAVTR